MMAFCQGTCTDSNAPDSAPHASTAVSHDSSNYDNLKFRTFLRKIIWEFAFACVPSFCRGKNNGKCFKKISLKHNKALLLAESGGEGGGAEVLANADPQSVHSSFRFSFGSQVEREALNMSSSLEYESRAREMNWKRMESLEKCISPVAKNLIRFNYKEIMYATHNFSKGILLSLLGKCYWLRKQR